MKVKVKSLSRVQLFATPWTVAYQASPSMGFSRQGYWSGLPFPSPRDLPNPEIEPGSRTLQADFLASEPPGKLLTIWTSVSKVMSLPFNAVSRFVIAFLPRSKHLFISLATGTVLSDSGAEENKTCHC